MHKGIGSVALLLIGGAAFYYLYRSLQSGNSPATARGVTDSTKGSITSTPISLSRVAAVAIGDPLKWVGSVTNRAAQLIPSNLSNGSYAGNWRLPFGNPESAAAASQAVKQTNVSNYRPSTWAGVNFRSGV
jgi:hypothetical protein